ncbi:trigger factor [Phosphitispora sp. TUW77]|uniref:trigger factor n=1 Tax=Phosphitispora sp. TUW77 TaxID=3152361 RepID=UPI003AB81191
MKVNMEKIEKNIVALEIEVEQSKIQEATEKAYKKIVKKISIPGFRKGKAPRVLVEKHVGKDYINEEALDTVVPQEYYEAIKETNIQPIDKPKIDIVQFEEGKPFIFKATVEVKPEVELGQYIGIEVERKEDEITDIEVNAELERLRNRHAQLVNIEEGAAEEKDSVIIDFEGFIDNEPFQGGTGTDYSLELGSGTFIPGFEEKLIGAKVGEVRDVEVKFPDDYHSVELAGKDALFKVTVKGIKRKELADLDDEFAKDVSEFETLEELKNDIMNRLKEVAEKQALTRLQDELVQKIVENCNVEVPDLLIEQRIDGMLQGFSQRLSMQGLSMEDFLKHTDNDIDAIRSEYRSSAEKAVKTDLILEAIAHKENIMVFDEEVDARVAEMAKNYSAEPEVFRNWLESGGNMESLMKSIVIDKILIQLVEKAVIK